MAVSLFLRRRSVVRPALVMALAVVVLLGIGQLPGLLPSIPNPFAGRTHDRSDPAVLQALQDVSEYRAARANFSVVVDVQKDTRFLPSFVKGERTVFLASGSVDASVDLSGVDARSLKVSRDGKTVTMTLPQAALSQPQLDHRRSRIVSRDRGIVDRVGSVFADSPTGERDLYLLAGRKLSAAAASDRELVLRAQRNTERMLERLLAPTGVERVDVIFVAH